MVDQHFVPAAFLLEFQGVIRNVVALGVDPCPTPAQRFEVKERFTGLITDNTLKLEQKRRRHKVLVDQVNLPDVWPPTGRPAWVT